MKINTKEDLKVIVIEKDSLDLYIDFINLIKSTLDRKEFLGEFSRSELMDILDNKGYIFMYKFGSILVACTMLIPASEGDMEEFGLDVDYHKVMEIGPQAVFADLRGNGIQDYMLKEMEKMCKNLGFEHLISSAHPDNVYSINNFKKNNYHKIGQKTYTRGIRNIYYKDI